MKGTNDFIKLTLSAGSVRVLERGFPAASTQTYSAKTLSAGKGKSRYLAMTAGSNADRPVVFVRTPPMCKADVLCWGAIGAKAVVETAKAITDRAMESFMVIFDVRKKYQQLPEIMSAGNAE